MTELEQLLDDNQFEAQLKRDLKEDDDDYEARRKRGGKKRGSKTRAAKKRSIRKHMTAIKKLRRQLRKL